MANDHIHPAAGAWAGVELQLASRYLRDSINQINKAFAIMTHLNDGADFTPLEAAFGLQTGQGQTVFDLLNGTLGALNGTMQNSNARSLIDRIA